MKKLFLLLMTTCFLSVSALAERVVTGQVVYEADGEPLVRPYCLLEVVMVRLPIMTVTSQSHCLMV